MNKHKEYFIGWFTSLGFHNWNQRIIHRIEDDISYPIIQIVEEENQFIIVMAHFLKIQIEDSLNKKVQHYFTSLNESKIYCENILNQLNYKILDKDIMCFK